MIAGARSRGVIAQPRAAMGSRDPVRGEQSPLLFLADGEGNNCRARPGDGILPREVAGHLQGCRKGGGSFLQPPKHPGVVALLVAQAKRGPVAPAELWVPAWGQPPLRGIILSFRPSSQTLSSRSSGSRSTQ